MPEWPKHAYYVSFQFYNPITHPYPPVIRPKFPVISKCQTLNVKEAKFSHLHFEMNMRINKLLLFCILGCILFLSLKQLLHVKQSILTIFSFNLKALYKIIRMIAIKIKFKKYYYTGDCGYIKQITLTGLDFTLNITFMCCDLIPFLFNEFHLQYINVICVFIIFIILIFPEKN